MVRPWEHFGGAKNNKSPTLSRNIREGRFRNLAVKERFERPLLVSPHLP